MPLASNLSFGARLKLSEEQDVEKPVHQPQSQQHLPCFAHHALDPEFYPSDWCAPLMKTPPPGIIESWKDDEISDGDSDVQEHSTAKQSSVEPKRAPKTDGKERRGLNDKRTKITGGRPAVSKRVTADLDSEDELIVRMKEARYLEKDIAQALIDRGYTAYNPKTIGTRWRRLKVALQRRQDERLDDDLSDWHDDDDDVLIRAVEKANAAITQSRAELEIRKWRMVADFMKKEKAVVNFSSNACRKRFEDLILGCEKPTPESIPNPSPEILKRIESRRHKQRMIDEAHTLATGEQTNEAVIGWSSMQQHHF